MRPKIEPLVLRTPKVPRGTKLIDAGTAVLALKPNQCRYIYGDPKADACAYCRRRAWFRSYCKEHYYLTHVERR